MHVLPLVRYVLTLHRYVWWSLQESAGASSGQSLSIVSQKHIIRFPKHQLCVKCIKKLFVKLNRTHHLLFLSFYNCYYKNIYKLSNILQIVKILQFTLFIR